jgi:SagB-type dehydrogenase family enzyme
MEENLIENIIYYHDATKHHFQKPARGPGFMDWSTQPDPFRGFEGAPVARLPLGEKDETPPYHKLFSPGAIAPASLNIKSISSFFELSLAISAWKQSGGSRWALRCNPSSGNLHPTEGYAVLPAVEDLLLKPGVFHYAPIEHGLERRTAFSPDVWDELMSAFPAGSFLAGLSSIHWREAWKYGERAFRYCNHDIGHALAAYQLSASSLGWNMVLLDEVDDASISSLFGLDREDDFEDAEREHPDLVALVYPGTEDYPANLNLNKEVIKTIADGTWVGQANQLSPARRPWEIIDMAAESSFKPKESKIENDRFKGIDTEPIMRMSPAMEAVSSGQIIRQRRSAVSMDGVTHIDSEDFYTVMAHTLHRLPCAGISWSPRIHFCLYVHRVNGLTPGLYFLARDSNKLQLAKDSFKKEFLWEKPENCPDWMDLYLLQKADFRQASAQVSCTQAIAGQGAFSLGMLAEFKNSLNEFGAWFYRRLFWESGMVGQMLYLSAEFIGVRGTGIGCYFDDPVHAILGLKDKTFQSLYHFTIGGPEEDPRLRNE